MRRAILAAAIVGSAMVASRGFAVTTIGAVPGPGGRAQEALGETFTVPVGDHFLTQFTFGHAVVGDPQGAPGVFHIAPWNGSAPGADVFANSFPAYLTYTPIVENTGLLDLTPGGTYVAYLTTAVAHPINAYTSPGTAYAGGTLVWFQTGFGWKADAADDVAFSATFVPEPGLLGLASPAALALTRRRRRAR